jgi:hypothetical protein
MFALQTYLTVSAFDNYFNFKRLQLNKWALMCVGFVISLLNFSPYPWPTLDGIFFASIAFWLISKLKTINPYQLFIIALFTVLSALTKQSFYLVPLLFLFLIYNKFQLKTTALFFIQLLFWVGIYFCFIYSITDFQTFLKQTTGETHFYDLYIAGLHNYIFISISSFLLLGLFLISSISVYLYFTKQKLEVLAPFFKWICIILFTISIVFCFFNEIPLASRIVFDACIIAVFYAYFFQKKSLLFIAPIIVSLGIAWSASISMGYPYPILHSTGIIVSFLVLMKNEFKLNKVSYFVIAFIICLIAVSYNLKPYREQNIFKLTHSLETVSHKLKYIKTNKNSYEKYTELKQLVNQYGENFIVAPSLPIANYLFNSQSELPSDWITENEVNRQQSRYIKLASNPKNYIFLEKSFLNHEEFVPQKLENFSSIAVFIHQNFNCIGETNHFLIYNRIKTDKKLP